MELYPLAKLLKIIQYLLLCFGDDVVKNILMIVCIDVIMRRTVCSD
jgi:hypothetical protein